MQKSYPPDGGMPAYGIYPPENGFKYENGYGGGGGGGGGHHYGAAIPENMGLYYGGGGNCGGGGVTGLQNQTSGLGGPMDGCPPMPGDYGTDPGSNGHYGGGMGGVPCGQNTSLNCGPPGMGGLHIGVGGKQQTEIYPWMKESRQNNKRQNVSGKNRVFDLTPLWVPFSRSVAV